MKNSKIIELIVLIVILGTFRSEASNYRLSILTCGQGDDLYATFGHSAIRVIDSTSGLDEVYNYGTFEFSDDLWFYVKFTRGKLRYMLDVSSYQDFEDIYIQDGRKLSEQVLNLSQNEITRVHNFLKSNIEGENKYYKYDFYYDNCSTRIRDLFEKVLDKKLSWSVEKNDGKTMRQNLNPYIKEMPWIKWGFYLTLGHVTDVKADFRAKMFLPFELESAFDKAQIRSENGQFSPLVSQKIIILDQNSNPPVDYLIDPVYLILIVVMLIGCYVSHMQFYKNIYWKWYDLLVFGIVGLLGILILFLWFLTDHQTTHWNYNILWALPTHLLYLVIMLNYKRFYTYSVIAGILIGLSLAASIIQPFHLATYIVIFILVMRLYVNYRYAKHYNVRRLAFSKLF